MITTAFSMSISMFQHSIYIRPNRHLAKVSELLLAVVVVAAAASLTHAAKCIKHKVQHCSETSFNSKSFLVRPICKYILHAALNTHTYTGIYKDCIWKCIVMCTLYRYIQMYTKNFFILFLAFSLALASRCIERVSLSTGTNNRTHHYVNHFTHSSLCSTQPKSCSKRHGTTRVGGEKKITYEERKSNGYDEAPKCGDNV